jgi:hypothetical protein
MSPVHVLLHANVGCVGRVKKLSVVIGERGRGLGVVRTELSEIITLRDNSPVGNSPFIHTSSFWAGGISSFCRQLRRLYKNVME